MASSENDGSNKQSISNESGEEANIYEDEINLIDYFLVIWKYKWFILIASLIPALLVGARLFRSPRGYKISYTYTVELGEKAFKVLEDTFYSTENQEKLVEKLQEAGFDRHAKALSETKTAEGLKGFVSFEILPSYLMVIKPSGAKNLEELRKIKQIKGSLLVMRVGTKSEENTRGIALVCRKNFEQIMPLYSVREELNSKITSFKEKMGGIEEARYMSNLQLERKKTTMEKLKSSSSEGLDKLPGDIILQFNNVGGNSAFLPLAYQVQAAGTQIINFEEQIRTNKEKYDYYNDLLALNQKLFAELKRSISSYYTIQQFRLFLIELVKEVEREELKDYLSSYIKKIENKISTSAPVSENPNISSIAKGTVKKSGFVFAIALMMSVFASFLLEGLKKAKAQTS